MTNLGQCRRCSRPCTYIRIRLCRSCLGSLEGAAYSNNPEVRRQFVAMVLG